jgi:hypothetical protein
MIFAHLCQTLNNIVKGNQKMINLLIVAVTKIFYLLTQIKQSRANLAVQILLDNKKKALKLILVMSLLHIKKANNINNRLSNLF